MRVSLNNKTLSNFNRINFRDFQIVGASPEILVRLRDNKITVRPIAGTRPRGKTKKQDLYLIYF